MRFHALLSLVLLMAAPSALKAGEAPQNRQLETQLVARRAEMLQALFKPDPVKAADFLSDRLQYIRTSGEVLTKPQQLERMKTRPQSRPHVIETTVQIYRDAAVLSGEVQYRHGPPPAPGVADEAPLRYRATTVFANERGVWRMILWQENRIAEPGG